MKNKKIIIFLIILIIAALAIGAAYWYKFFYNNNETNVEQIANAENNTLVVETKKSIYSGNDRPIAVMIDNNINALPHAGLSKAYMVYEIIVEGGESRLMALFKGVNLDKIGPVRSSRHYFLDFALENDAIYVHYGWSPKAESNIKSFGINNINGIIDSDVFWRVKDKSAPHNAVTSTDKILKFAKEKGYRLTSNSESVLNYSKDEVQLNNEINATEISIPFSESNVSKWEYDAENKNYFRYSKGKQEVEWDSKSPVKFKNIIIEFMKNTKLQDNENKDRQEIITTGINDGYYITNGKAIKIKCSKTSRSSKTKYLDESGNEIKVNDDNTFVQICPINANVTIN